MQSFWRVSHSFRSHKFLASDRVSLPADRDRRLSTCSLPALLQKLVSVCRMCCLHITAQRYGARESCQASAAVCGRGLRLSSTTQHANVLCLCCPCTWLSTQHLGWNSNTEGAPLSVDSINVVSPGLAVVVYDHGNQRSLPQLHCL